MSNETLLSEEEIEQIAARAEKATAGPWAKLLYVDDEELRERLSSPNHDPDDPKHETPDGAWFFYQGNGARFMFIDGDGNADAVTWATATFIAHARTDIPSLLSDRKAKDAQIKALEEERDELRGRLQESDEWMGAVRKACADAMGGNTAFIDDDVARAIYNLRSELTRTKAKLDPIAQMAEKADVRAALASAHSAAIEEAAKIADGVADGEQALSGRARGTDDGVVHSFGQSVAKEIASAIRALNLGEKDNG